MQPTCAGQRSATVGYGQQLALLVVIATSLPACTWGIYDPGLVDGGSTSEAGSTSEEGSAAPSKGWFTIVTTSGTPHRITTAQGLAFANSTTLFWAQAPDQIKECTLTTPPPQGGSVSCNSTPGTFATSNAPDHIVWEKDVIYWADDPVAGDGNLDACGAAGSNPCDQDGGPTVIRNRGTLTNTRLFNYDTTALYWAENDQSGGSIFRCPLPCFASPSSPIATSSGTISTFAVLPASMGSLPAGALVWGTSAEQIWSCVPGGSGCPPTMVATLNFTPFAISGGDSNTPVLLTGNGAVNRLDCAMTGCNASPIFQVTNDTTTFINWDNSNFYVATTGGSVYASPRDGSGSLTLVASGQGQINGLTHDGTYVYWTSGTGWVGGAAR